MFTPRAPQGHVQVFAANLNWSVGRWTAPEFRHEVARVGGFPARKADGEPGRQTNHRRWQKLDLLTIGAGLGPAKEKKCA